MNNLRQILFLIIATLAINAVSESAQEYVFEGANAYIEYCHYSLALNPDTIADNLVSQAEVTQHINELCYLHCCNCAADQQGEQSLLYAQFEDMPFVLQYYFALSTCLNPEFNSTTTDETFEHSVDAYSSIAGKQQENEDIIPLLHNYRAQSVCDYNTTDISTDEIFAIALQTDTSTEQVLGFCTDIIPKLLQLGILNLPPTIAPTIAPTLAPSMTAVPSTSPTPSPILINDDIYDHDDVGLIEDLVLYYTIVVQVMDKGIDSDNDDIQQVRRNQQQQQSYLRALQAKSNNNDSSNSEYMSNSNNISEEGYPYITEIIEYGTENALYTTYGVPAKVYVQVMDEDMGYFDCIVNGISSNTCLIIQCTLTFLTNNIDDIDVDVIISTLPPVSDSILYQSINEQQQQYQHDDNTHDDDSSTAVAGVEIVTLAYTTEYTQRTPNNQSFSSTTDNNNALLISSGVLLGILVSMGVTLVYGDKVRDKVHMYKNTKNKRHLNKRDAPGTAIGRIRQQRSEKDLDVEDAVLLRSNSTLLHELPMNPLNHHTTDGAPPSYKSNNNNDTNRKSYTEWKAHRVNSAQHTCQDADCEVCQSLSYSWAMTTVTAGQVVSGVTASMSSSVDYHTPRNTSNTPTIHGVVPSNISTDKAKKIPSNTNANANKTTTSIEEAMDTNNWAMVEYLLHHPSEQQHQHIVQDSYSLCDSRSMSSGISVDSHISSSNSRVLIDDNNHNEQEYMYSTMEEMVQRGDWRAVTKYALSLDMRRDSSSSNNSDRVLLEDAKDGKEKNDVDGKILQEIPTFTTITDTIQPMYDDFDDDDDDADDNEENNHTILLTESYEEDHTSSFDHQHQHSPLDPDTTMKNVNVLEQMARHSLRMSSSLDDEKILDHSDSNDDNFIPYDHTSTEVNVVPMDENDDDDDDGGVLLDVVMKHTRGNHRSMSMQDNDEGENEDDKLMVRGTMSTPTPPTASITTVANFSTNPSTTVVAPLTPESNISQSSFSSKNLTPFLVKQHSPTYDDNNVTGACTDIDSTASKKDIEEALKEEIHELVSRTCPEELVHLQDMLVAFEDDLDALKMLLLERLKLQQQQEQQEQQEQQLGEKREVVMVISDAPLAPPSIVYDTVTSSDVSAVDLPTSIITTNADTSSSPLQVGDNEGSTSILLEEAINEGDWNAVATRAALLSDQQNNDDENTDVSSLESSSFNSSTFTGERAGSSFTDNSSMRSSIATDFSSVDSDSDEEEKKQLQELEDLIDAGDWRGLLEVANKAASLENTTHKR